MSQNLYLITGPSGSGKTTLSNYLSSQGYACIDADSTPGLCYYVNKNNKPVPYPQGADEAWWQSHNYVWELDRLNKHIDSLRSTGAPMFLCGNAGNIKKAWDMFKTVFYLDIPENIMLSRIATGDQDHNFGQRVDERNQLVRWAAPFKTEMLELGAVTIDATPPLPDVAKTILEHVKTSTNA
ncbi:MAG TPA: AAA family ATPase [Candidatus Saccharimonadia bacterium]|nr:AAA family ATPase [Candidatus Saccharimonadia bacterium]